jgi:hypothetical protein
VPEIERMPLEINIRQPRNLFLTPIFSGNSRQPEAKFAILRQIHRWKNVRKWLAFARPAL